MKFVDSMPGDTVVFRNRIIARQEPNENEVCMAMRCVNSMSDDIVVFVSCIITRQGSSESDVRISMRCVFCMSDEHVWVYLSRPAPVER